MGSDTASSPSPELAARLHRLRSTLARLQAELELARADRTAPPVEALMGDIHVALELLGSVEATLFALASVMVVDDDERLAELTARGLRRFGYAASTSAHWRTPTAGEVAVFDLGSAAQMAEEERDALRASRPIVVTGAGDPGSRAMAERLGAFDYLVKPVDMDELADAVRRRLSAEKEKV